VNCSSRHDLPTPAAKQSKAAKQGQQGKAVSIIIVGSGLDLRLLAAAAAAGARIQSWNRGREGGRGPTGRTCVADDDVLEEVGVRHLLPVVAGLVLRGGWGSGTKKSCKGISRAGEGIGVGRMMNEKKKRRGELELQVAFA